jgi:hypothetical protein
MLLPLLLSVFGSAGSGVTPAVEAATGKYAVEHRMALAEVGASTGFSAEHATAKESVSGVSGLSTEHAQALRAIMDAGV